MEPITLALVINKGGLSRMLHLAEMAVVLGVHTRQPAEMRAEAEAYIKCRGLPEVEPLPWTIKPLPV